MLTEGTRNIKSDQHNGKHAIEKKEMKENRPVFVV